MSPELPPEHKTVDAEKRWRLWRQDDNGNPFPMDSLHDSPEAALQALTGFEERGHKQTYWIEPEPSSADDGGPFSQ
jgi:hypothetical protein